MAGINQSVSIRITADGDTAKRSLDDVNRSLGGISQQAGIASNSFRHLSASFAGGQIVADLAQRAAGSFRAMGAAIVDSGLAMEKLNRQLQFTAGAAAGKELDYLRNVSARLGMEFNSAASAYGKLTAAANGTSIAGDKARAIFEGVGKAAAALGLSSAEAEGALQAIQQMISKGTVSAEELRGQLGERLPGAFQIAARSMGVTTAELGKMLEQGRVMAGDFLPKFAAELDKTFGDSASSAAGSAQAAINKMTKAWEDLKRSMADSGGLHAAAAGANKIAALINMFNWSDHARLADKLREIAALEEEIGLQQTMQADTSGMEMRVRVLQGEIEALRGTAEAQRALNAARAAPGAQASREALRAHEAQSIAEAAKPLNDYIAARKSAAQKMRDEIAAEQAAFAALNTGSREAEEAHYRTLAAIREKYARKVGGDETAALREYDAAALGMADALKVLAAEEKAWAAQAKIGADYVAAQIAPIEQRAAALEREAETYGQTEGEIQRTLLARLEEARAMAAINGASDAHLSYLEREIAARQRLAQAADAKGALDAGAQAQRDAARVADKAAADAERAWEDFSRDIERSLTDSLYRAFEAGEGFGETFVKSLQNTLKSTVLKVAVQAMVSPVTSALGLGGGASGAASSGLNLLGGGSNLYGSFATSAIGQSVGLSQSIGSMGLLAEDAAFFSSFGGDALLTGLGESIGAALPWIGGALALASLFDSGGGPKTEGGLVQTIGGGATEVSSTGQKFFTGDNADTAIAALLDPLATGIADMARKLGGDASGLEIGLGFNSDPAGTSGDSVGGGVYKDGEELYFRAFGGYAQGSYQTELAAETNRILLAALESLDLNDVADAYLDSLDIAGLSADAATQAVQFVQATQAVVDAFGVLGVSASDVTMELITAMGGMDAAVASLSAYYQTYYDEAERNEILTGQLADQFADLNLTMPATKDEFRSLIESLDLTTTSGQGAYASLMGMAPAFATVADAAEAMIDSLYQEILGRDPDAAGAEYWRQRLAAGTTADEMRAEITNSPEARLGGAIKTMDSALKALSESVEAERDRLDAAYTSSADAIAESIETIGLSIEKLDALSAGLRGTLAAMRPDDYFKAQDYRAAQGKLASVLATARNGGELPGIDDLRPTLDRLAAGNRDSFTSRSAYLLDYARTAQQLDQLADLTDAKQDVQERTVEVLELQNDLLDRQHTDNMARLDAILKTTEDQAAVAKGTYEETKNLALATWDAYQAIGNVAWLRHGELSVEAVAGITDALLAAEAQVNAVVGSDYSAIALDVAGLTTIAELSAVASEEALVTLAAVTETAYAKVAEATAAVADTTAASYDGLIALFDQHYVAQAQSGADLVASLDSFSMVAESALSAGMTDIATALDSRIGEIGTSIDALSEMYATLLGRTPDAEGMAYWVGQAISGIPLDEIRASIANSEEALSVLAQRLSGDGSMSSTIFDGFLGGLFDDLPDLTIDASAIPELTIDASAIPDLSIDASAIPELTVTLDDVAQAMLADLTLDLNGVSAVTLDMSAMAGDIASTNRHLAVIAGQKTEDVVTSMYRRVLGREADAEGLDYWRMQLAMADGNLQAILPAFEEGARANGEAVRHMGIIAAAGDRLQETWSMVEHETDADGQDRWRTVDIKSQTPSSDSAAWFAISEMVAELKALRREVEELRKNNDAANNAVASNTGKVARFFDASSDGESIAVRMVA